jgi:hypothetical protein
MGEPQTEEVNFLVQNESRVGNSNLYQKKIQITQNQGNCWDSGEYD